MVYVSPPGSVCVLGKGPFRLSASSSDTHMPSDRLIFKGYVEVKFCFSHKQRTEKGEENPRKEGNIRGCGMLLSTRGRQMSGSEGRLELGE